METINLRTTRILDLDVNEPTPPLVLPPWHWWRGQLFDLWNFTKKYFSWVGKQTLNILDLLTNLFLAHPPGFEEIEKSRLKAHQYRGIIY